MARDFEVVAAYRGCGIRMPVRKTELSAGYDLEAAEEVIIAPGKVSFVPTGLKAYMNQDEVLQIYIRSGFSAKNRLSLVNSVGIIDADYADNPDNEGHILIAVINHGDQPVTVVKGQAVAQAVFCKYLVTDEDCPGRVRTGGFGSTDPGTGNR